MANHHSCIRRLRQTKARTLHNRYYAKTMRNAVRKLRAMENKEEAEKLLPTVQAMLDKLAKTNIIHKNKAANLTSSLALHVRKLA
ncbi:MAG: 30S ribosomal protein S20 [Bacteroidaceae bacterium]|nr:30S ribosomal protein S20 [Bacteroidaceae bacterium]